MFQLEEEINRQIALSLAKKRGPYAKYARGILKKLYITRLKFMNTFPRSTEALSSPLSPVASSSKAILPADGKETEPEVDDVIADINLKAVKECLTPSEAAVVDSSSIAISLSTAPDQTQDESILMPPPDATYLQLRHHLSINDIYPLLLPVVSHP